MVPFKLKITYTNYKIIKLYPTQPHLQKQVQTNTNTQTAPTSWIIGGDESGSSESLVTLDDGRLCGTLLPPVPAGVSGMSAGYSAGRVYTCGGTDGRILYMIE